MNIPEILTLIRPGEQWVIRGNEYSALEWLDSTPKPTVEELEAGQAVLDKLSYRAQRAEKYPPIGDQLDAMWFGGEAAIEMKAKIDAVKAKFPKN